MRIGHLLGGWLDVLALEGGTATARTLSGASWVTRQATIEADYQNGTASPTTIEGIIASIAAWRNAQSSFAQVLQTKIGQTFIDMVNADQPLPSKDVTSALKYLIAQMQAASTTFNASVPSVGALTSVGSPVGNLVMVSSVKNGAGAALQYVVPETITVQTTTDAQSGGATLGVETLTLKGAAGSPSQWNYNWPLGSATSASYSCVSGTSNNTNGNMLVNGDYSVATNTNVLDNWTIATGAATTNVVFSSSAHAYTTGGGSIEFLSDGSTLTGITQLFNQASATGIGAGGTPAKLSPDTVYHFSAWIAGGDALAAGVLEVALVDGSATILNDDAGTANSFTKALSTVTTSFVNVSGAFRTPASLPTTVKLRIRLSTAMTTAKILYIGRASFTPARPLYAGGPYLSFHSGNVATLLNDSWTTAVTNTYGTFQKEFDRFLGMRGLGLQLPATTSSPTVGDALCL